MATGCVLGAPRWVHDYFVCFTWGVLMTEHRAVAAEQEAKSRRNEADLTGKISAILAFVFCEGNTRYIVDPEQSYV